MIDLRTLGTLALVGADGTPIAPVLSQPRRVALLCYLALARPRGFQRRDTLYPIFWPEHDAGQARHALRQSLYFLRQALGADTILSRGDAELALAPGAVRCDAWEFEAALDRGDAETALAHYRGELLTGFHVSDAPEFERWLSLERDRLRRRAVEAAWALSQEREQAGDAAGAIEAGRLATLRAPGDETEFRRLLLLLDRLGDRGGAVRAYQAFAAALKQDYDLQPSAETEALLSKIRSSPARAPLEPVATQALPPTPARPRTSGEHLAGPPVPTSGGSPRRATWAASVLVLLLLFTLALTYLPRRAHPPRSIAVLPFRNLRGDSAGDYFSDGVTEEILHALAQIPDLRVAARTSAFRFKGKEVDVREVGALLGVAAVLEGSVQREGDAVRMTMRLIDTRTGYQIWSARFDRRLDELFAVEDEISRALADTLKLTLGLVARPPGIPSVEGHDLYFRGLSLLALRGPGLLQAINHFAAALAIDSTFAPAWAGLSRAYELLPAYYLASYDSVLPLAEQAARRAIALDSTLGTGHAALAGVYRDRMQWAEAERAYRRALRLGPNDAETIEQYGQFLFWTGQPAAALSWMRRARRLDPLAPIPATTTGTAYLFLHQYDSAIAMHREASELAPNLPLPYMWRMWAELSAGRHDSAQRAGHRLAEASGIDPEIYSLLIRAVADPRRRQEALGSLARIPESASWALSGTYRVNWLMLLGDTAGALNAVDRLTSRPYYDGILTLWNPPLDPIRRHPRFLAALRRLELPFRSTDQR